MRLQRAFSGAEADYSPDALVFTGPAIHSKTRFCYRL
jgi:hypothetical protein